MLKLEPDEPTTARNIQLINIQDYLARMKARPAFDVEVIQEIRPPVFYRTTVLPERWPPRLVKKARGVEIIQTRDVAREKQPFVARVPICIRTVRGPVRGYPTNIFRRRRIFC